LPIDARASVIVLAAQLEAMRTLIGSIEKRIKTQHRSNEVSRRVETIPGIGVHVIYLMWRKGVFQ
jgi:transposase